MTRRIHIEYAQKMPNSTVSIIVHMHAVSRSVLNWTNFRFRVIISFSKLSHLVRYTFAIMNFEVSNKPVIRRYLYVEFCICMIGKIFFRKKLNFTLNLRYAVDTSACSEEHRLVGGDS